MKPRTKHYTLAIAGVLCVLLAGVIVFVYSGAYDIGADAPHTRIVFSIMQLLRERSIEARSSGIRVPPLDDPQLILKGAGQYAAMCVQCHLTPEKKDSELRAGLYPQPPDLSRTRVDPQRAFWIIKHGVKMSAMPAWGASHDDQTIWSMVAFLRKLPDLTPAQYKDVVSRAPPDKDMEGMDMHGQH